MTTFNLTVSSLVCSALVLFISSITIVAFPYLRRVNRCREDPPKTGLEVIYQQEPDKLRVKPLDELPDAVQTKFEYVPVVSLCISY